MLLLAHEIEAAVKLLRQGEIVAFPTETVYGLGASIYHEAAIAKIFHAKNRPSDNPLIAHIADFNQAHRIARSLSDEFFLLAEHFWPGPLTMVVPKRPNVPHIASAGLDCIGVRMPAHPLAILLIEELGEPLVAPSANLSGKPSATCASHVVHDFEGKIAAVIDGGPCEIGLESTVLDLTNPSQPQILRPGAITADAIEDVLKTKVSCCTSSESLAPRSPGMKYRHYAPEAPVTIYTVIEELEQAFTEDCHVLAPLGTPLNCPYVPLSQQNLYAELRCADSKGCRHILVFCDGNIRANMALMNRLYKASQTI